ncbi:MAG TPA: cupin domain-containing protein [Gemmatimonadaceae bacterium]|jgi:quercetin dioxygenase-like cupin family protein
MTGEPKKSDDLEHAVALASLVDYQPGAVVSRTIVKKKSGTVTAFAFDEGEGLSEHTAAYDALIVLVEGACDVTIAGAPHHVAAGELLRLPANQPHALKATERFKMLLVMIKE